MRISDWSSDVCSSDLPRQDHLTHSIAGTEELGAGIHHRHAEQPDEGTADAEADAIPVGAHRSGGALGQSCARLRPGLCLAITAAEVLHHICSGRAAHLGVAEQWDEVVDTECPLDVPRA